MTVMGKRTRKPVYTRVVELIKERGLRPGFVAEKLFMTSANLSHHIAGHHGMRFNLRELTTLAELFNVSVDYLKGTDDD